MTTTIFKVHFR